MWDCPECGCRNIAESVDECPMCGAPNPESKPAAPDLSDQEQPEQQASGKTTKARSRRAQGNS
jgi:hypothetical protein